MFYSYCFLFVVLVVFAIGLSVKESILITWMVFKLSTLLSLPLFHGLQEYSNENTLYMPFHYFNKNLLSAYCVLINHCFNLEYINEKTHILLKFTL